MEALNRNHHKNTWRHSYHKYAFEHWILSVSRPGKRTYDGYREQVLLPICFFHKPRAWSTPKLDSLQRERKYRHWVLRTSCMLLASRPSRTFRTKVAYVNKPQLSRVHSIQFWRGKRALPLSWSSKSETGQNPYPPWALSAQHPGLPDNWWCSSKSRCSVARRDKVDSLKPYHRKITMSFWLMSSHLQLIKVIGWIKALVGKLQTLL